MSEFGYEQESTLGKRLKQLREQRSRRAGRDLTQELVARESGVKLRSLQKWETDQQVPDAGNLLKLARYYGVAPEYILGEGPQDKVAEPRPRYGVPESLESGDLDRRRSEILAAVDLDPLEKSALLLDLTLSLRAEALRDLGRASRLEAEEAARRRAELAARERRYPPPVEPGNPTPAPRPGGDDDRGEQVA